MTRDREPQDLHLKRDLIPAIGITSYLVRVFNELDLSKIRETRRSIGLNFLVLTAYNSLIGLVADRLIDNYF